MHTGDLTLLVDGGWVGCIWVFVEDIKLPFVRDLLVWDPRLLVQCFLVARPCRLPITKGNMKSLQCRSEAEMGSKEAMGWQGMRNRTVVLSGVHAAGPTGLNRPRVRPSWSPQQRCAKGCVGAQRSRADKQ